MARRDPTHDGVALSALMFFEKPRLWEYGYDEAKWPELEAALDSVKDFHIVDALTQRHQSKIAKLVDGGVSANGCWGLLHSLAYHSTDDSKAIPLVQGLLQMGAHPDLVEAGIHRWTPSHVCARMGFVDVARALVLCRANLALKDTDGDTPAACWARRCNNPGVANVFEEAERNGFPTIAQLAHEGKWWAVQNLCRRGIVPEQEKFALHQGKDAIGWAMYHIAFGVLEELEFLLKPWKAELRRSDAEKEAMKKVLNEQREHIQQLQADQAVLKKEGNDLKELVLLDRAKMSDDRKGLKEQLLASLKAEISELKSDLQEKLDHQQLDQLEQATMKKEVDELKEMLLLNLGKTSQDHEDLKNELTALKGKHSKLKDDLQGKLNHQSEQLKQMKVDCKDEGASLMQEVAENEQPTQAAGPVSESKSVQGNEDEKSARLEAEKKALKDKLDQLQGVLRAQSALLSSYLRADL